MYVYVYIYIYIYICIYTYTYTNKHTNNNNNNKTNNNKYNNNDNDNTKNDTYKREGEGGAARGRIEDLLVGCPLAETSRMIFLGTWAVERRDRVVVGRIEVSAPPRSKPMRSQ